MSKKAALRLKIAPLQRVVAEPITDPAEQAALDKAHERAKRQRETGFGIDSFLDDVNEWKLALHEELERMTPAQRRVFWEAIHEEAGRHGVFLGEASRAAKPQAKRGRRTG